MLWLSWNIYLYYFQSSLNMNPLLTDSQRLCQMYCGFPIHSPSRECALVFPEILLLLLLLLVFFQVRNMLLSLPSMVRFRQSIMFIILLWDVPPRVCENPPRSFRSGHPIKGMCLRHWSALNVAQNSTKEANLRLRPTPEKGHYLI